MAPTLSNLAGQPVQSVVYYAAIGCVAAGLFIILWVAFALRRSSSGSRAENDGADTVPTGTVREAERLLRLMGEAEEQATRLAQDYQARAERLGSLLKEAEARIARLERVVAANADTGSRSLERERIDESQRQSSEVEPGLRVVTRPVPGYSADSAPVTSTASAPTIPSGFIDLPSSSAAAAVRTAPAAPRAVPVIPTAISETAAEDKRNQTMSNASHDLNGTASVSTDAAAEALAGSVYRLADQGLSAHDIAHRLNQQAGTIELILALRQG